MANDRRSPVELLDEGLAALERGRSEEFAELVREAWRATRDPELAHSYALVLRELAGPSLPGADPRERAASWTTRAREHAGDPLELWVLVSEPWTPEADELERLRLLAAWSPDPLLAEVLAGRLRIPTIPPQSPGAEELRRQTLALLGAQGDPRQLETLDRLAGESLPAQTRSELRRARARLAGARPSPQTASRRQALARLARKAAPRREFEARSAELLAAIHEQPDADEPRLVYADWLAQAGDPRGELIGLQVERARTGAPASGREHQLLTRHGHVWAGPLNAVLGGAGRVFERGFVHAGSVEVPNLDGEIVELPEWSTLRILDGHVSDALARRGRLDHLRELYGFLALDRFVALRADNRLARVEHYECSLADPNLSFATPLSLRSLLVRRALDDSLLALLESPAIAGLEQLGVYYGTTPGLGADHRERRSAAHRVELLRERLPSHVRRLRLIDERTARASRPCGWMLSLERDELGLLSRLRVDWLAPPPDRRASPAFELRDLLGPLLDAWVRTLVLGRVLVDDRPMVEVLLRDLAESWECEAVVIDANASEDGVGGE